MLSDVDGDDHYSPSLRVLEIAKAEPNWGFRLTRSRWDPYPWVAAVDGGSAAEAAGVLPGDCLLEVNGTDVVGRRISEVAEIVRSRAESVALLLWNAGTDLHCSQEALCCGPMPRNLQRLSACMSTILAFLECPVCLDTIPPPTYQCDNGHLMCLRCRARTERCPICRIRLTKGRSILSDQIYNAFTQAFDLRGEPEEKRAAKLQQIFKLRPKNKNVPDIKVTHTQTNRFLSRVLGKSSSDDNLANDSAKEMRNQTFLRADLKTKSLSSNEINNCAMSPALSRASSMERRDTKKGRSYLDVDKSASIHASFESLNLASLATDLDRRGEDISYRCPYDGGCLLKIRGAEMIEHFRTAHDGPLIQYFKPMISLSFSSMKTFDQKTSCVIYHDSTVFFFKIHRVPDGGEGFFDLLLWVWCLGDEKKAAEYECVVTVTDDKRKYVLLDVTSSVFSLDSVTWGQVKTKRRGVFLTSCVIKALMTIPYCDPTVYVAIAKKD